MLIVFDNINYITYLWTQIKKYSDSIIYNTEYKSKKNNAAKAIY